MTRTCGAFHPSFGTKIYLTNVWSIELCTSVSSIFFILSLTNNVITRYPTHTLFRFLLVSNSLDLILDIILKLWTDVFGKIMTFPYLLVSLFVTPLRFFDSVCSQRSSFRPWLRCAGRKKKSLLLDLCYFHNPYFFCSSRSFSKLAYP